VFWISRSKAAFVDHAGMHIGDFAVAVDEQGYRHAFADAELLCGFKRSNHER